jgi:branched-chain amino acid transport system permease protein
MSVPADVGVRSGTKSEMGRREGISRLGWPLALLVLLVLPFLATNDYQRYLLDLIMINVILAVGLNIVKGFAGQVTLGHIALAAVGAYSSAVLLVKFSLPFWIVLPAATLLAGLAGVIVGIPALRVEGAYLALVTLGLAETVRLIIATTDYLGSSAGIGGIPAPSVGGYSLDSYTRYYYLVMPLMLAALYLSFCILRSDMGRAFKALREDPIAAAAAGINITKYKIIAFIISAMYAGCAGSLQAQMSPGYIHPDSYTIMEMLTVILMVVLGGIGNVWGGVIGAGVVTIVFEWTAGYYEYQLLAFGLAIVFIILYMPSGIGGLIERHQTVRRFRWLRAAK